MNWKGNWIQGATKPAQPNTQVSNEKFNDAFKVYCTGRKRANLCVFLDQIIVFMERDALDIVARGFSTTPDIPHAVSSVFFSLCVSFSDCLQLISSYHTAYLFMYVTKIDLDMCCLVGGSRCGMMRRSSCLMAR